MSKFDVIFKYVLFTTVCVLVGSIVAALGLPLIVSMFFGGLIGWNWSYVIYPWIDKKLKDIIR